MRPRARTVIRRQAPLWRPALAQGSGGRRIPVARASSAGEGYASTRWLATAHVSVPPSTQAVRTVAGTAAVARRERVIGTTGNRVA